MQRLIIKGGKQLAGELTVQGAKNSALPILAGCVLAGSQVKLRGIPELSDVYAACRILSSLGVKTSFENGTVTAAPTGISSPATVSGPKAVNCYDLSGRHVNRDALKPGIYIWNGRKIVRY